MGPTNAVYELIFSHLPSYELARHLSESYLERAAWLFGGVSKQQLMEEMLPLFYPERGRDSGSPTGNIDYSESQSLGLLLFIFAIGALVEINQEPCNAEGERYYQLARAAMSLKPVFVMPSLVTIQALHLCSVYDAMTGNEARDESESMETSWGMFTLSAQLAQSVCHLAHHISLLIKICKLRLVSVSPLSIGLVQDDPGLRLCCRPRWC